MSLPSVTAIPDSALIPLDQFSLIHASGEDAASFLHNQLTNDMLNLAPDQARIAGYCTAKGRLLATLLVWREADSFVLMVPSTLREALQRRLQMFVLRARVKLEWLSDHAVTGFFGNPAARLAKTGLVRQPLVPYQLVSDQTVRLLRVADADGIARHLMTGPRQTLAHLTDQAGNPALASLWDLSEIHAGLARILPATQEKFVPQMVNLELVGGVSFKKGCYPGQEIVARTQYLGKQKRRMVLAHVAAQQVQPGEELFAATDPDQPCGTVVNAAPAADPAGGYDCLVEIKLGFYPEIPVLNAAGQRFEWRQLPYDLPDEHHTASSEN